MWLSIKKINVFLFIFSQDWRLARAGAWSFRFVFSRTFVFHWSSTSRMSLKKILWYLIQRFDLHLKWESLTFTKTTFSKRNIKRFWSEDRIGFWSICQNYLLYFIVLNLWCPKAQLMWGALEIFEDEITDWRIVRGFDKTIFWHFQSSEYDALTSSCL